MGFIESIDPFIMQLYIVPLIVIGLGMLEAYRTGIIFIGPLTTLLLNILYEVLYTKHYHPSAAITLSSWNFIFPVISLIFSLIIVSIKINEIE